MEKSIRDNTPLVVDPNVVKELPSGGKILNASLFGTPSWSSTAVIEVEESASRISKYFLKFDSSANGAAMMEGEYASMSAIYGTIPMNVPRPIAWGRFERSSDTYYCLSTFIGMSSRIASLRKLCFCLANLHYGTTSPNGKFGFHLPTYHGPTVQINGWDHDWTRFFTKLMTRFFERHQEVNKPWPELHKAFQRIIEFVIPKLLEPLQLHGRSITPVLVHGDLWQGNIASNLDNGAVVIFDAASFYAHNEYELGTWRCHNFDGRGFDYYKEAYSPSEPTEQWDDRIMLYSLKFEIAHGIGWPGLPLFQKRLLDNMLFLIEKYENPEKVVNKPVGPNQEVLAREIREHYPEFGEHELNFTRAGSRTAI